MILLKKVIYYITDHGKGHTTRSIAIIKELQKFNVNVTIRNSNSIDFLENSLENIQVISGLTDIGPKILPDGFSIDESNSKPILHKWIKNLENDSVQENELISKLEPDLIISDISAMPFLVAKKQKRNSIAISNFSWYDVLKFLDSADLNVLENAYDIANLVIQLPFGTEMNHFKNKKRVGIVARKPTNSREEIRKKLKIKNNEYLISIALGHSNHTINCKFGNEVKVLSMNSNVAGENVLSLPSFIPSHNAISASNLVIGKCGYGLISECLTNGIPFFYLVDDKHLEQKAMSAELSEKKLGRRISYEILNELTFDKKFFQNLPKIKKMPIDNETVAHKILEFL